MIVNYLDLQFFAEEEVKVEDNENKEEQVEKTNEQDEVITLKKSELELLKNNKFAEGARKAEKNILEKYGIESLEDLKKFKEQADLTKKEYETLKSTLEEKEKLLSDRELELSKNKAENYIMKQQVKEEYVEDLLAILKGRDLEYTEENINTLVEKHPEWLEKKVGQIGTYKQKSNEKNLKDIPKVF